MRQSLRGIIQDFLKYGLFSIKEIIYLIVTALIFGFIFSFRDTSVETYTFARYISNIITFSLFSLAALTILQLGHRGMAVHLGYIPTYKPWGMGLGINVFLSFISTGYIVFLSPGGFELKEKEGLHIGKKFTGIVFKEKAYIVFFGLLALVIYSGILKLLPMSEGLIRQGTIVALIIGAYSLLPIDLLFSIFHKKIPASNGTILLFGKRAFAVFTVVFFIAAFLSNIYLSIAWAFVFALALATLAYGIWTLFFDPNRWWQG
jgi:hypothetical protein